MYPILACARGKWEIVTQQEVFSLVNGMGLGAPNENGFFVLDFLQEIEEVRKKMAVKAEAAAKEAKTSGGQR